jgi:hypothetical protein
VRTRHALLVAVAAACAVAAVSAAAWGAGTARSVVANDAAGDVATAPDLTRFALRAVGGGKVRASLTLAAPWKARSLRARTGPPGSLCVRLWTTSDPPDMGPDYLVCATVRADGRRLRGSVLRERPNQLPERVASAKVTRPSTRTLRLFFAEAALGRPATLEAAAEATRAGCAAIECVDTAPDAPGSLRLRLHRR